MLMKSRNDLLLRRGFLAFVGFTFVVLAALLLFLPSEPIWRGAIQFSQGAIPNPDCIVEGPCAVAALPARALTIELADLELRDNLARQIPFALPERSMRLFKRTLRGLVLLNGELRIELSAASQSDVDLALDAVKSFAVERSQQNTARYVGLTRTVLSYLSLTDTAHEAVKKCPDCDGRRADLALKIALDSIEPVNWRRVSQVDFATPEATWQGTAQITAVVLALLSAVALGTIVLD